MYNIVIPQKIKNKKERFGPVLPPPKHSSSFYVQIHPSKVSMFKFFLEAMDNLGYISVVDRWRATLKVVFSPHQEKEIKAWCKALQGEMEFEIICLASSATGHKLP